MDILNFEWWTNFGFSDWVLEESVWTPLYSNIEWYFQVLLSYMPVIIFSVFAFIWLRLIFRFLRPRSISSSLEKKSTQKRWTIWDSFDYKPKKKRNVINNKHKKNK